MPKPQQTYIAVKGKTKIAANAADAKGKLAMNKAGSLPPVEALLKRAKVEPADLAAGLKIIEEAKKATAEKIDETTAGKAKKVVELVKKIVDQIDKATTEEKKLFAEIRQPGHQVIGTDIKAGMELKALSSSLTLLTIVLMAIIKLRMKEKR